MTEQKKKKSFISSRGMGQVLTVTVGLILLIIAFGIINPNFISSKNIPNLLRQTVPFIIIGIGQSYVLITGNIDLSIGSVVGMSSMVSATLMSKGYNVILSVLIAFFVSLLVGLINGLLVAKAKLPPFIATLGTMTVARGVAQLVNNNRNTNSIGNDAKAFRDFLYYGKLGGVFICVWLAIVIFLIFNFILSKTRTGRHIYAVGSNMEAAKLSGVNATATVIKVYLVSAFCACIVGLILTASAGMGAMDSGASYEMYAVAASVIGGVSTLGGQGILLGTVVGASIWSVLQNGLDLAGISAGWKNVVVGVIVVISVFIDVVVRMRKSSKK